MDDDLGPVPEGECSVEHLPARQLGAQTQHPHPLPEVARAFGLCLRGLEQRTAALLALVDEERKHHQVGEHRAEVALAVAEVVLEAVALVLQGVEGLVLDAPARSRATHQRHHVGVVDGQVGDPREALFLAVGAGLPVLEEVHLQFEVRVVERRRVEISEPVMHTVFVGVLMGLHRAGVDPLGRLHPLEQRLVVSRLRPHDEAHVELLQQLDVRPVRGEPILDHDELQVRMLAAHITQQALRRIALAVVLRRPVALHDGLRREGEDLALLGRGPHIAFGPVNNFVPTLGVVLPKILP